MRADTTLVQLRPRPMYEAADLGVRLVQASAPALLRCALPVYGALVLLCASLLPLAPWAPALALWMAKPWLDRTLLFVLARAVFRQDSRFGDLWAAGRATWWGQLLSTFTRQRFAPWRSYTQPAMQLEGLAGAALRKRRAVLLRGHQGEGMALATAFVHIESAIVIGLLASSMWLVPGGDGSSAFRWLFSEDDPLRTAIGFGCYALAVGLVEPFFVGAGFAMYLNRRVEIEAWDVEQALRHAFAGA